MRRTAQALLLITTVSACSMPAQEYPGSFPRPILHSTPIPPNNLIPADYTPPSYRIPLLATHRALIDTFSVTYADAPAAFTLQTLLHSLNFTVDLQPAPPPPINFPCPTSPEYNILAFPGRNHGPSPSLHNRVLLTAHMNTHRNWFPYALHTSYIPRNASVDFAALAPGTYIVGRGAVHAKAAIAAQIVAVSELLAAGVVRPESVGLLFVSGGHHTYGGSGMQRFSAWMDGRAPTGREQLRAVIFGEPTGGKLACGARGFAWGSIYARAEEEGDGEGVAAVVRGAVGRVMGRVFGRGGRFGETRVIVRKLVSEKGIRGLVPGFAMVKVEVEVAAGDKGSGAEMVVDEIWRVVVDGEHTKGLGMTFRDVYGPIACECDVNGFETMIADSGSDMPYLEGNYARYMYGPGSAHPPGGYEEGLAVKELEDAVEGYKRLIMHALESPFPPPTLSVDTCPTR